VVVLHEAFGVSGPEPDSAPLAPDAVFPIASASKPVTGTLAMQLVEDGLLGLNRPAVEYLPELAAGGEGVDEISVHHLLTHSSGYTDVGTIGWTMQKFAEGKAPDLTSGADILSEATMRTRWDCPRTHPLGSIMSYCQHNYILMGEILRRLCGQSLDELARERLFAPLGMRDTSYGLRDDLRARRVRRPDGFPMAKEIALVGAPGVETPEWEASQNGAGGLFSTSGDIGVFAQTVLNGGRYGDARILSRPAVLAMTRDQVPGISAEIMGHEMSEGSYGYGWIVEGASKWGVGHGSFQSIGTAYHQGAAGVAFWVDPAHEIVGVYLEVLKEAGPDLTPLSWHFDIYQNLVTAAVDD
jgi:CubicO group peptidase (beta-lactamase class C family)